MSASLVDCVRDEVALRLDDGAPLAEVEGELIETVPGLSEDERAAVWLFAWSYRPSTRSQTETRPRLPSG
jgi:hypothetical protein